ncbi:MAG: iron-sulfur cluster loop, partial [Candidatus Korarchaeota archaeon]
MEFDKEQIELIGKRLSEISIVPYIPDDPQYYPPPGDHIENVANFFLFMVAQDHRCYLPGGDYSMRLHGKLLRGAELLYALAMERYTEDPHFFTPARMRRISKEDIEALFSRNGVTLPDVHTRVFLWNDLAEKLIALYRGSFLDLLTMTRGFLYETQGGFVDRMRVFRAYEDPVEKKTFLLYKFLHRRNIFFARDIHMVHVPVDNHLVRLAVRLGIVEIPKHLELLFYWKKHATVEEDTIIRLSIRSAYDELCRYANISPLTLDDFLWSHGRTVCLREHPSCDKCVLNQCCAGYTHKKFLFEHLYTRTWY